MKVVLCTTYYQQYLDYFYRKHCGLSETSYRTQMEAILDDCFVSWGGLARCFKKIDSDSCLIIPNCKPLQTAWAKENNITFSVSDWQFTIAIEQAKKIKPDVFYIGSMFDYYGEFLDKIRKYTRNIFGWISCRIPNGTPYHRLDLILSSLPSLVDKFKNEGVCSEYLNSGFDVTVLTKLIPPATKDIDFSFVGSITRDHKNRTQFVKELLSKTSLQLFGINVKTLDDRNILQKLFSKNIYGHRLNDEVYGLDMYRILQRSKITFNKHIDMSREYIGNARMFEATGIGTLLLSDGLNAPTKVFHEDEVVYYDTAQDAIEKFNYYLQHEEERLKIAKKGQQRTLAEYSCEIITRRMLDLFRKYMR